MKYVGRFTAANRKYYDKAQMVLFVFVTGICSSLLAVIEQLRERQAEDATIGRGTRRKRKRESKVRSRNDMGM